MRIDPSVLSVLENGRVEGNLYYLPEDTLERAMYLKVNKVLESIGGKWNRKQKAHVFDGDFADLLDSVILTGSVVDKKNELQFFETPNDIADRMVDLAKVTGHDLVLEPSAGKGQIACAVMRKTGRSNNIHCVELHEPHAKYLQSIGFEHVFNGDFLEYNTGTLQYDAIVMNPPFSGQQDILHVKHALSMLNPDGGRLVSVMSPSVVFRTNKLTVGFRKMLEEYNHQIFGLPEKSFRPSGTDVDTVILSVVCAGGFRKNSPGDKY